MKAVPDQIAPFMGKPFTTLGIDGYGRRDTRDALRSYFEADSAHIAVAVLASLVEQGELGADVVATAIERYEIDPEDPAPWTV